MTAVTCGTPIPATTLVVHIEPGPIPTLTASTPASQRALAAAPVAILPAITWRSGNADLISLRVVIIFLECPCAESITIQSTLALTRAWTLSITFAVMPTAAPARSRPCESWAEDGYFTLFSISLIVISPLNLYSSSTIGSFSFLALPSIFLASSRVVPTGAVIRFSLVMHSFIGLS